MRKKDIFKTLRFKDIVGQLINDWNSLKQIKEKQKQNQGILLLLSNFYQEKKQIKIRLEDNCKILKESLKNNCPLCGRLKVKYETKKMLKVQ